MDIQAPLTGTILRILVAEGDSVAAGDPVAVMESMKMEINVDALLDGTVRKIIKREGDQVQADEPLMTIE
jgi:biotin carboxyl carrier protein